MDVASFWDRESAERTHVSWVTNPLIRDYVNRAVGNGRPLWPLDWLQEELAGRTFGRVLSIGCGSGALERDLLRRGLCQSADAFDGSVGALALARAAADAEGVGKRVRYFAADFNEPFFPRRTYDAVFFHQSAHHVAKLEKLFRAVLLALKPDGLLYLDEYVGPSRFEWTDERIAPHRAVYATLPAEVREYDELPYPIKHLDPSEGYRSSEIEPQLAVGFDTVARRPYGGTIISVVYAALRDERIVDDADVERMIEAERRMLASGEPAYYTLILARPKHGMRGAIANAWYWLVPKLKRVGRAMRGQP